MGKSIPFALMENFIVSRIPNMEGGRLQRLLQVVLQPEFVREERATAPAPPVPEWIDLESIFTLDDAADLLGHDKNWESISAPDLRILVSEELHALWAQRNLHLTEVTAPKQLVKASMARIAKLSQRKRFDGGRRPRTAPLQDPGELAQQLPPNLKLKDSAEAPT